MTAELEHLTRPGLASAAERRKLNLGASDSSRICQQALYGHQVFSTDEDHHAFGKLDYFEDQRPAREEE